MTLQDAARRLLKSCLRRYILLALVEKFPEQAWPAQADVEAGIEESAWEDWKRTRLLYPLPEALAALQGALEDAILYARETFDGVGEDEWLVDRLQSFVTQFKIVKYLDA